jgi:hypothetical protein
LPSLKFFLVAVVMALIAPFVPEITSVPLVMLFMMAASPFKAAVGFCRMVMAAAFNSSGFCAAGGGVFFVGMWAMTPAVWVLVFGLVVIRVLVHR